MGGGEGESLNPEWISARAAGKGSEVGFARSRSLKRNLKAAHSLQLRSQLNR